MRWMKVLSFSFFAAVMLVVVNSCGVPSPVKSVATVEPVDASTIASTDAIIISFNTSMVPGTLSLTGDMVDESDRGVWFQDKNTNDTLVIRPNAVNGGFWSAGPHTLTVNVDASSGVALSPLTLNYTIEAAVPTVVEHAPVNTSTIIGSDRIIIRFSRTMDPSTLVLTGNMAVESGDVIWATALFTDDTLVISPSSAWSGSVDTLVIDVDSAEGAALSSFILFYTVDTNVASADPVPVSGSTISAFTPIVVTFGLEMDDTSIIITGSLRSEPASAILTDTINVNDTLTITPSIGWTEGPHDLFIEAKAFNGIPISKLSLSYIVADVPEVESISPSPGSLITSGESIIVTFNEAMDRLTLDLTGTPSALSYTEAWSDSSFTDDTLTLTPTSFWSGSVALILNADDLAGNPVAAVDLNYIVDDITPSGTAVPADGLILYENQNIIISFTESMNPASLNYSGSLELEVGGSAWSPDGGSVDDTLTVSPSSNWSTEAQTLGVTAEDVAGNLGILALDYTVFIASCNDGKLNFDVSEDETDLDCGGSCAPCDDGKECIDDTDCSSNSCDTSLATPVCHDDTDGDGLADVLDNCPLVPNSGQADFDSDGIGDDCDDDFDGDGFSNTTDNCPSIYNPGQKNLDGEGAGDICDTDDDNDGVNDALDSDTLLPSECRDIDGDLCDDCSSISFDDFSPLTIADPANDGLDTDDDGLCDIGDDDIDGDSEPNGTDCAPLDSLIFPAATENCYDALDNDCDGDVDFDDAECTATCGDGVLTAPEECDDGNTAGGDGCDATCTIEPAAICGDGIVTAPEECDGGGELASCDADCTNVFCGDGVLNTTALEQCDDGNTVGGDGCDAVCNNE